MKRVLLFFISVLMLVSLSACSSEPQSTTETTSEDKTISDIISEIKSEEFTVSAFVQSGADDVEISSIFNSTEGLDEKEAELLDRYQAEFVSIALDKEFVSDSGENYSNSNNALIISYTDGSDRPVMFYLTTDGYAKTTVNRGEASYYTINDTTVGEVIYETYANFAAEEVELFGASE